jgi:ABC-2 type transport system ATP-binding protein
MSQLSVSAAPQGVAAIEVVDVVKRYSSKGSKVSGLGFSFGALSQPKAYISVLLGGGQRNLVALDHISLTIPAGQVFGLLGPNGAGKTTLIKIISTLVLPDSGRALVYGLDVTKRPRAVLRKLQTALAEGVGFERRLTGRQNLEFYGDLYGLPKEVTKKRIEELLAFVNLSDHADAIYNRYSTGMARRLLICRVLMSEASVLVFDEPTSGLDPTTQVEFRKMLRDVLSKERGKTLIIASHNLWEVEQVCDRVAVMSKGRVIASGTPEEIKGSVEDRVTMSVLLASRPSGSLEEFVGRVKKVRGITSVHIGFQGDEKSPRIDVHGDENTDYEALLGEFVSSRLGIKSLDVSHPSLEDAYVKLISEEEA